jgi:hypothetical protein
MSADAVALCMGIRDSRHTLLISTGDLRIGTKDIKIKSPRNSKMGTKRRRLHVPGT